MGFYQFTFWPLESVKMCGEGGGTKGVFGSYYVCCFAIPKVKKKEKLIGPSWCPKNYI